MAEGGAVIPVTGLPFAAATASLASGGPESSNRGNMHSYFWVAVRMCARVTDAPYSAQTHPLSQHRRRSHQRSHAPD
jgi:hypothetical protein